MSDFIAYVITAFALIFVIEGLLYALFPGSVRRMFIVALALPEGRLRLFGAVMAASGFALVLLLNSFSGG